MCDVLCPGPEGGAHQPLDTGTFDQLERRSAVDIVVNFMYNV